MSAPTRAVPRWAGTSPRRTRPTRVATAGLTRPSRLVSAVKAVVLTACCVAVIGPFLAVVSTSLADATQVARAGGLVLWPTHPSFAAYRAILAGGLVTRSLIISIGITVVGTGLSLAFTTLLAYGLSRPGSFGSKPALMLVLLTMLFVPGIIPMYLTVKELHLLNSWWSLILPVMINGFNVIVTRSFFMELPQELMESARIDGASELGVFLRVVLPLSKPIVSVVGLFYAVSYWNAFFSAMLYLSSNDKWPLQLVLRSFVVNNEAINVDQMAMATGRIPPSQSLQMAILVISLIPIVIIYPFLQRHFAKGLLVGAVKG